MLGRHGLCPAVLASLLLHMCPPAIASAAAQATPFPWLIAASAGNGSWFSSNIESLTPERESRVVLTAQVHRRLIGRLRHDPAIVAPGRSRHESKGDRAARR